MKEVGDGTVTVNKGVEEEGEEEDGDEGGRTSHMVRGIMMLDTNTSCAAAVVCDGEDEGNVVGVSDDVA